MMGAKLFWWNTLSGKHEYATNKISEEHDYKGDMQMSERRLSTMSDQEFDLLID